MHKALLIFNPSSGRRRKHRAQQVEKALSVFRAAGVEAESCATTHTGSAVAQAQSALAQGFDTIIACGGDGTANEILNGLMLANSDASLGVLPFGSGNVLAANLRLPTHAEAAARTLLTYKPYPLHPGLIRYQDKTGPQQRYFAVVAGVGSDAELMYRTEVTSKERYGVYAYFLEMFHMAVSHRFSMFKVEWQEAAWNDAQKKVEWENQDEASRSEALPGSPASAGVARAGVRESCRSAEVAMIMGVRGSRFTGLLKRVQLDVELTRNHYRLLIFRTNKVRHFLNYFASVMTGMNWRVPQIELATSTWFRCTPLAAAGEKNVHAEVDGELLGTLPVEVTIAPRTFNLLMPQKQLATGN